MNNTFKTILIVLAVVLAAGGLFFAGMFFSGWRTASPYGYWGMPMTLAPGASAGVRGYGWNNQQSSYGYGPMMGAGRGGYGPMMGGRGYGPGYSSNVQPLTVEEAKGAAQKYVDSLGLSDLSLGEVMIFDNNAYVVVKETSTGLGAFELLVDPVSKIAYPEHGPNMMWNLKYGGLNHSRMMGGRGAGGMMNGYGWNSFSAAPADVSAEMPVTADQAVKAAQDYLDKYLPGNTAATDPVKFYGYYTLDFSKDGKIVGMLSVNGYNGAAFLHTWHGTFIEEAQ